MRVKVLFFSALRDVVGAEEVEWEVEGSDEATVGEVLDGLGEKWPGLKEWEGRLLLAVDLKYASRDDVVRDGQEMAVMPPVQGG